MILEDLQYVYIRVQGLIWVTNGLVESTNIRIGVGNEIDRIYNEVSTKIPLIIDFRNIESIADHTLDTLMINIEKNKRPVILINTNSVESSIVPNLPTKITSERFSDKDSRSLNIALNGSFNTKDFSVIVIGMMQKKIQSIVKASFSPFESKKHLASTPILANGIYDANKIIFDRESFFWVCLAMNDILKEVIATRFGAPIKLLSVSLRSAPFASVLSQFNKIPLETIDHLGPRHKVFDLDILPNLIDKKKFSYIYVGDFCFGGTEIKIAKTYAQFAQSTFESAIVIGTLLPQDTFADDFDLRAVLGLGALGADSGAEFKFIESK